MLKYVDNIQNKKGRKVATMHLYNSIGGEKGVNASDFVNEMNSLAADRINLRINSGGGGVLEGFGIFSALLNFKNAGGELHTYNDGVAASTAGWLLMAADPENIHSKDYAILMLHGVSGDTPNNNFQKAIQKIFKNRTGLDVDSLLTNGADNFFDADEATNYGFFPKNNIENTGVSLDIPENFDAMEVANKAQSIINNNNSINPKPLIMKKVVNALGLQEGSSEEILLTAVNSLKKDRDDALNSLVEAETKATEQTNTIATMQNKLDAQSVATATVMVENYISKGVFSPKDETAKAELVKNATKDPEAFETMAKMIPIKSPKLPTNKGGLGSAGDASEELATAINGRSLRELEKADSGLVARIKNESIDTYVNLYNMQYGTAKTAEELA